MPINTVIREKRKEIGLTQEQVADYLGVTAPAVNKWEKGATYPDVALLPALARLLKTDLNALLCFRDGPSKQEILNITGEIAKTIKKDGFARGFDMATENIREYPDCAELIHSTAMLLDGALMMSGIGANERAGYDAQIVGLYERAADSGNAAVRAGAAYILASRYIRQDKYDRAGDMLSRIPEFSALDRRTLEAELLVKQGKTADGAALLERKLQSTLNEMQVLLIKLVGIYMAEGQPETAEHVAGLSQKLSRLFGLWDLSAYAAPLEAALAQQKIPESLDALESVLAALFTPWDIGGSILYRHCRVSQKTPEDFGRQFLPGVLEELRTDEKYNFLRSSPEFQRIFDRYTEKLRIES